MKEEFPGHFRPSKEDFEKLWRSGLIVLDASVLLNLYRYSAETRKEFIRVLGTFQDRLWLPHRAAEEFFRNRMSVIAQQEKTYDEAGKSLEKIEKDFQNRRQHPFISTNLLAKLIDIHKQVQAELNTSKETHRKLITEDVILTELDALFRGRVGPATASEEADKICAEGKQRYEKKIPPGYKDVSKDETDPTRRYGDLILWKQILEKSKIDKRSIILLLDDRKEDWWMIHEGRTIGPRPELVKEARTYTEQDCYMYQPDSFLTYAVTYANQEVSAPAITELRELRQSREVARKRTDYKTLTPEIASLGEMLTARKSETWDQLSVNAVVLNDLIVRLANLKHTFESADPSTTLSSDWNEVTRLQDQLAVLKTERSALMKRHVENELEIHEFKKRFGDLPE